MNKLLRAILVIILLFPALNLIGQEGTSVEEALDDGDISTPKVVLKVHPSTALVGEIPVSAEFVLFRQVSLQASLGVIGPFGSSIVQSLSGIHEQNIRSGYSWRVQPRIYFSKKNAPFAAYNSIQFRQRLFVCRPDLPFPYVKAKHSGFLYGVGFHKYYKARISFDLGLFTGLQLVSWWEADVLVPYKFPKWTLSIDFAIGYRF